MVERRSVYATKPIKICSVSNEIEDLFGDGDCIDSNEAHCHKLDLILWILGARDAFEQGTTLTHVWNGKWLAYAYVLVGLELGFQVLLEEFLIVELLEEREKPSTLFCFKVCWLGLMKAMYEKVWVGLELKRSECFQYRSSYYEFDNWMFIPCQSVEDNESNTKIYMMFMLFTIGISIEI